MFRLGNILSIVVYVDLSFLPRRSVFFRFLFPNVLAYLTTRLTNIYLNPTIQALDKDFCLGALIIKTINNKENYLYPNELNRT